MVQAMGSPFPSERWDAAVGTVASTWPRQKSELATFRMETAKRLEGPGAGYRRKSDSRGLDFAHVHEEQSQIRARFFSCGCTQKRSMYRTRPVVRLYAAIGGELTSCANA